MCRFLITVVIFWLCILLEDYVNHHEGIFNGADGDSVCHSGSHCASFCITAGEAEKGLSCIYASEQLCRDKFMQIEACSSFTLTKWDLISKTLARLHYTKKPVGRGCSRWREEGWKANLGDVYVLRVPLGPPWIGKIWQKRSVQQKNPPLCLSMGY